MNNEKPMEDKRWLTMEASAVDKTLKKINAAELAGSMEYRGDIATLRRLGGRMPVDDAIATAAAIRMLSRNGLVLKDDVHSYDSLTNGERAAVVALGLSSQSRLSYEPNGLSFGHVFASVVNSDNEHGKGLFNLMRKIVTDDDFDSLVYDLSNAINRMGDAKIDYAQLTNDLIRYQNVDKRQSVLTKWTKDYYSVLSFDRNR